MQINNFDLYLSLVLGHTILLESKGHEPLGEIWLVNGGDPPAPDPSAYSNANFASLRENLPGIIQAANQGAVPTAQSGLAAAQAVTPGYSQLGIDTLRQYLPQYADVGNQVNEQNAQANAQTDLDVLGGTGGQLARTAADLQNQVDPQTAQIRNLESGRIQDLLGSINLNGLSGGEQAAIERANAQGALATGNLGNDSAINTVKNASNFGNALQSKRDALTKALDTATAFLPASKSGIDATQVGLGRPSVNSGVSQFAPSPGAQQGVATSAGAGTSLANSALGATTDIFNNSANINANRRDSLDRATGTLSSLPT